MKPDLMLALELHDEQCQFVLVGPDPKHPYKSCRIAGRSKNEQILALLACLLQCNPDTTQDAPKSDDERR